MGTASNANSGDRSPACDHPSLVPALYRPCCRAHVVPHPQGRPRHQRRLLPRRPQARGRRHRRVTAADQSLRRAVGRTERCRIRPGPARHGLGDRDRHRDRAAGPVFPASLPEKRHHDSPGVSRRAIRPVDPGNNNHHLSGGLRGDPAADHPLCGSSRPERDDRCGRADRDQERDRGALAERLDHRADRLGLRALRRAADHCGVRYAQRHRAARRRVADHVLRPASCRRRRRGDGRARRDPYRPGRPTELHRCC